MEKILKCSGSTFDLDRSKMPHKLCDTCYGDFKASFRFYQNCREANTVFHCVHEEEEPEVVATFELQQQQIKFPLGIKIKKMQNSEVKERQVSSSSKNAENVEQVEDIEEDSIEINYDEQDNVEHLNITEAEDTLDEELYMEETEEEDLSAVDLNYEPPTQEKSPATLRQLSSLQNVPPKRGRGRPRKCEANQLEQANPVKANFQEDKVTVKRRRRTIPPELRSAKICEICGNSYKYQHALKAHMRRHTNDRPFACEFCDKSFVACVELRRHMRVHTGHKPYPCHYCDRRFSDFGSRRKHERTHTGERPYRCTTCNKSFAYAHVLSVHVRTHTGEKRFQCQRCGKGFTKKAYLLAHHNHHGRSACLPIDSLDSKASQADSQQEDCVFTFAEDLSNEVVTIKEEEEEFIINYDYEGNENDFQHESLRESDCVEEDQMAEEHLEDVDDGDILYELS